MNVDRNMVTVPDLTGMSPEAALATLDATGLSGEVLKQTGSNEPVTEESLWPSGVVIKQSVDPGTRLVRESDKIIELTISG